VPILAVCPSSPYVEIIFFSVRGVFLFSRTLRASCRRDFRIPDRSLSWLIWYCPFFPHLRFFTTPHMGVCDLSGFSPFFPYRSLLPIPRLVISPQVPLPLRIIFFPPSGRSFLLLFLFLLFFFRIAVSIRDANAAVSSRAWEYPDVYSAPCPLKVPSPEHPSFPPIFLHFHFFFSPSAKGIISSLLGVDPAMPLYSPLPSVRNGHLLVSGLLFCVFLRG